MKNIELDYISPHTQKFILTSTNSTTHVLDINTNGLQTQQTLLLGGKKLRALTKAHSSPQPYVCPQSSTILRPSSLTLYKDYYQTRAMTQHSINQPCSAGMENLAPREHLIWSATELSLPKLEYNSVSKRRSMLSRYLDSKSREVNLPRS